MGTNMQRLGATLSNRMKKTANGAVPTTIELGVVNANLSITTDSLQDPIPRGDYMISSSLTGNGYVSLYAGARVLIAWCGFEPVVIAVVISS